MKPIRSASRAINLSIVATELGKFRSAFREVPRGVLLNQKVLKSFQKSRERAFNDHTSFCNDINGISQRMRRRDYRWQTTYYSNNFKVWSVCSSETPRGRQLSFCQISPLVLSALLISQHQNQKNQKNKLQDQGSHMI